MVRLVLLTITSLAMACHEPDPESPSDDPDAYDVDTSVAYEAKIGKPRWVVPSAALPAGAAPMAANNNVDIFLFAGRLYLGWRTAETHFASPRAKMVLISSPDEGTTWELERVVTLGADVREPRFMAVGERLFFYFFEAGTLPMTFAPKRMLRMERTGPGQWSDPVAFGNPKQVPWTIRWRRGRALMTSYLGTHYDLDNPGELDVLLSTSDDGVTFRPLDPAHKSVYHGGVSEAAFELDGEGGLWAVTRNEDGDASGFGSHVCYAPPGKLARWQCPAKSDPERYDSPWIIRHGDELYLVARRDVGGPFDQGTSGLTFAERKKKYLLDYSMRPKRTALYRIDRTKREVVHLLDLPSAGDTAFPSVRRTGAHSFLLANYSSPLDKPQLGWMKAQVAAEGTRIYLLDLSFVPRKR